MHLSVVAPNDFDQFSFEAVSGYHTVYIRGRGFTAYCELSENPAGTYVDVSGHNFWDAAQWNVQPDYAVTKVWQKVLIVFDKCMTSLGKEQARHFTWSVDPGNIGGPFKWGMGWLYDELFLVQFERLSKRFSEFAYAANCGGYSDIVADLRGTYFIFPSTWVYEGTYAHLPDITDPIVLENDMQRLEITGQLFYLKEIFG